MTIITDPFLLTAWMAGIGIALMSAPVGCFIAWQRLVYFGDTVAHAALLGVVLALLIHAAPVAGILSIAVLVALIVATQQHDNFLPVDSLLGIIAHGTLALGLVIISQSSITVDVNGLLFGDILATSQQDVMLIYVLALANCLLLWRVWKPLMRYVLHADIAQVEGINTKQYRLLLMLMIALVVAASIPLVGIVLITSLLIIPAASARLLAKSPMSMVVIATLASMASVTLGFVASLHYDTPTGPSIILVSLGIFVTLAVAKTFRIR